MILICIGKVTKLLEINKNVDKKFIAEFGVLVAKKILKLYEFDIIRIFEDSSLFKNKEVTATFLRETYIIVFNNEWLESSNDIEIIACAFHKVRHAYQQAQIDFREQLEIQETEEVIKLWGNEINNYKQPTGKYDNNLYYNARFIKLKENELGSFFVDIIQHGKLFYGNLLFDDGVPHLEKSMSEILKIAEDKEINIIDEYNLLFGIVIDKYGIMLSLETADLKAYKYLVRKQLKRYKSLSIINLEYL